MRGELAYASLNQILGVKAVVHYESIRQVSEEFDVSS